MSSWQEKQDSCFTTKFPATRVQGTYAPYSFHIKAVTEFSRPKYLILKLQLEFDMYDQLASGRGRETRVFQEASRYLGVGFVRTTHHTRFIYYVIVVTEVSRNI